MIFEAILYFLVTHKLLGYIIIFLAMIFEGDIMLFTAAFLSHQGYFDPVDMFFVALVGAMVGDISWYYLGLYSSKFSKISHWLGKVTHRVDRHLIERPFRTLFLSKFIYGLHHPILMRAGSQRLDLNKYIKNEFFSILIWMLIIGGLGFLFGAYFFVVKKYLHYAEIGFLISVIIFFVIERFLVGSQLEKKI